MSIIMIVLGRVPLRDLHDELAFGILWQTWWQNGHEGNSIALKDSLG